MERVNICTVPTLVKLASLAFPPDQYLEYRNNPMYRFLKMDAHICCRMVQTIIQMNSADGIFNPLGEREDIYDKVVASDNFIDMDFFRSAIKYGHLDCLHMVEEFGCPLKVNWEYHVYANYNFIDYQIYLKKHSRQRCSQFCSMAAYYGKLECLKFFHKRGLPWNPLTCVAAILGDNTDCLKYALDNGCPMDTPEVIQAAAFMGKLFTIKYLYEHGSPWSITACNRAARNGHLECLKFMRDNGCPWSVKTVTAAVKSNNFECLKYLVDSGCPLNPGDPIEEAAYHGHLKCLKYLHQHGCQWTNDTCNYTESQIKLSITYSHLKRPIVDEFDCEDAYKDIEITRVPMCKNVEHHHDANYFNEQRECLTYAWLNGAPWDKGTCSAGSGDGRMDCLSNEPDHNCMWDEDVFDGHAAVVRQTRPITSALLVPMLLKCVDRAFLCLPDDIKRRILANRNLLKQNSNNLYLTN
ncbi:hypothetical protein ACI65C_007380 [Semiaphis heraclei]